MPKVLLVSCSLQQSSKEAAAGQEQQTHSLQDRIDGLESELAEAYQSAQESSQRNANLDLKLDAVW